jgi:hypothetical protein
MFASEVWFSSPAELLGLLVTIAGIWFVVQQLREAKLASQMEGLLQLQSQYREIGNKADELRALIYSPNWRSLSPKEAYLAIETNPKAHQSYDDISNFYENLGSLVKIKALDMDLVFMTLGPPSAGLFRFLKKAVQAQRIRDEYPDLLAHWEWLALEFEKQV